MRARQRVAVRQGCGIEEASFSGRGGISVVIIKWLLTDTLMCKETAPCYGKTP